MPKRDGATHAIDPVIQALFDRIPKSGDFWDMSERNIWLLALEASLKIVYKDYEERD